MNDERGHTIGDELIKAFAQILTTELRSNDVSARVGGDEFLAVVVDSAQPEVEALADRLLSAASNTLVAGIPIRVSMGIAKGEATDRFEDVARSADVALYAAKHSGGGKYQFAVRGRPLTDQIDAGDAVTYHLPTNDKDAA